MWSENPRRVGVYIDHQNQWHRVNDLFDRFYRGANIDPLRLGERLASRVSGGSLAYVSVYDGLADEELDPLTFAAQKREHQAWRQGGRGLVSVVTKPLEYLPGQVRQRAVDVQLAVDVVGDACEALFDVALVVSHDRDLAPVQEAVRRVSSGERLVAFVGWGSGPLTLADPLTCGPCPPRLWLCGHDFASVVDWTNYGRPLGQSRASR